MSSTEQTTAGARNYKVKRINFYGRTQVPIFCQEENGPCPLLSICNVLSLRNQLDIPANCTSLSEQRLISLVAERILDSNQLTEGRTREQHLAEYEANLRQNIADCLDALGKLTTGVDVNLRFHSPLGFEPTPEVAVFDLLDITLVHGWLVDPQDVDTARVLGSRSYNELVELMISGMDSDAVQRFESSTGLMRRGSSMRRQQRSPEQAEGAAPGAGGVGSPSAKAQQQPHPVADLLGDEVPMSPSSTSQQQAPPAAPAVAAASPVPGSPAAPLDLLSGEPMPLGTAASVDQPQEQQLAADAAALSLSDVAATAAESGAEGEQGQVAPAPAAGAAGAEAEAATPPAEGAQQPAPAAAAAEQQQVADQDEDADLVSSRAAGPQQPQQAAPEAPPAAASSAAEAPKAPEAEPCTPLPRQDSGNARARAAYDALMVQDFLQATCSQLTVYGIASMLESLRDNQLAVFFRNNHFNVIHKRGPALYLLVTDQGYLGVEQVVWERLDAVDGDTQLCGADFQAHTAQEAQGVEHEAGAGAHHQHTAGIPPGALEGLSEADAAAIAEAAGEPLPPRRQPASAAAAPQAALGAHAGAHVQAQADADLALAIALQEEEEEAMRQAEAAARQQQQQQQAAARGQASGAYQQQQQQGARAGGQQPQYRISGSQQQQQQQQQQQGARAAYAAQRPRPAAAPPAPKDESKCAIM